MPNRRPHLPASTLSAAVMFLAACAAPPATTPGDGLITRSQTGVESTLPDDASTPAPTSTDTSPPLNSTAQRIETVLGRLPACEDDERDTQPADIDGLILPADSRVVDVTEDGNLTTVEARVPLTPVEVRQFYEYQNLGILKSLMIEDEILEAEALVESRTHRMFVKAQAVCPTASTVYVVVAPGGSDARLPQPGDTDAPGAPPSDPAG